MGFTIPESVKRHGRALADLMYPRRCEGCERGLEFDRPWERQWLCDDCARGLPRVYPPFCQTCGEPYEGLMAGPFRCGNCAALDLHFEFAVAAFRADGLVRELIHRFKYQKEQHLAGVLGRMLARTLDDPRLAAEDLSAWTLVPVPLHPVRRREREYNQAWELCKALSKVAGISAVEALQRVRATTSQASLSRPQRIENLRGAFRLRRPSWWRRGRPTLATKKVLLVDDVLTTGSTTSECARILRREAKVERVAVITVARG